MQPVCKRSSACSAQPVKERLDADWLAPQSTGSGRLCRHWLSAGIRSRLEYGRRWSHWFLSTVPGKFRRPLGPVLEPSRSSGGCWEAAEFADIGSLAGGRSRLEYGWSWSQRSRGHWDVFWSFPELFQSLLGAPGSHWERLGAVGSTKIVVWRLPGAVGSTKIVVWRSPWGGEAVQRDAQPAEGTPQKVSF